MSLVGKTALVTGATGFLGGAVAKRLASEGVLVKALARRPNRDRYIRGIDNIEIVMGDITDAASIHQAVQGCDVVFHVAAALGGPLKAQRLVNVHGTRNVMQAAAEAGVQRVVHVSTIAVYGYTSRGDVYEDAPQKPGRVPYNVSKAEGEAVVRDAAAAHGLSYSIIRPGMIYGPYSSGWTKTMFRLAKRKPTIWVGDGSGYAHPIYIDDVVDLMVLLATHPAAESEAFNCSPDPAPTWREFLGSYSKLAGHQSWLGVPVPLLRLIAPLVEGVLTLRGEPQDVPQVVPFLMTHKTYKMDKARDLLGWEAKIALEEGIQRCVPYLQEEGLLA